MSGASTNLTNSYHKKNRFEQGNPTKNPLQELLQRVLWILKELLYGYAHRFKAVVVGRLYKVQAFGMSAYVNGIPAFSKLLG